MPVRKYFPETLAYIKVNSINQYTIEFCFSNLNFTSIAGEQRTLLTTIYYNIRVRPRKYLSLFFFTPKIVFQMSTVHFSDALRTYLSLLLILSALTCDSP